MSKSQDSLQHQIENLYVDHYRWLCNWLMRHVNSRDEATDLAQDVFVRLIRLKAMPQLEQPRGYLSRIAKGLLIDSWRRQKIEQAWLAILADQPEALTPSAEEIHEHLQLLIRIDTLLDKLKPRARQVFILARLEGLSCLQIATQLKVHVSTVERDLTAALQCCYKVLMDT